MTPADLIGPALSLTPDDLAKAAKALGVAVGRVRAVMDVESNGRGFHPDTRRPVILFEPHVFSRRTGGKFDASHPDISYPKWGTLPYPASQAQRYAQLGAALALAETAALESTSWGLFQIMGFNAGPAGFTSAREFVLAMCQSEGEQLMGFARFLLTQPSMISALRAGDWAGFARAYNGPNYAAHSYDQRLKSAAAREAARAA